MEPMRTILVSIASTRTYHSFYLDRLLENKATLPLLSETQLTKLKLLSLVSLSSERRVSQNDIYSFAVLSH